MYYDLSTITPKKSKIPPPQLLTDYNNIMSNVLPTTNYKQYIINYHKYIPNDVYLNYWLEYSLINPTVSLSEYIYKTIYSFFMGQLFETTIRSYYSESYLLIQDTKEETEYIDHICHIDIELYNDTQVIGLQCKSASFLNKEDTVKQYQIDMITNNYLNLYDRSTTAYIVVYGSDKQPMKYNNSCLISLTDILYINTKHLKPSTFNELFDELNHLLNNSNWRVYN